MVELQLVSIGIILGGKILVFGEECFDSCSCKQLTVTVLMICRNT
jgi:hypothetical protein